MHGSTVEAVHFHEVGAIDAIVDVTGAVLGLHLLGVGRGARLGAAGGRRLRRTAHGRMPVPGPGTVELLRGFPVVDTGVRAELVTPTGAAILTTLATGRRPDAGHDGRARRLRRGHGRPARHPQRAAVLRRRDRRGGGATETIAQVETTIDDMSPQLYEPLDGSALRGRCPRRFPHARHHEAQPSRHRADRPVPARPGGRSLPGAVRGIVDDRGALVGDVASPARPRDGDDHDRLRPAPVQGLATGRPDRDRHPRVRRRRRGSPARRGCRCARFSTRPGPTPGRCWGAS